ncbi:glucosamine-6-phosphate deaminase [Coprothermobacteraceae bacterium]|nr:glucosamine-6-phosphate deaminase [Coprothermobacteraceae bacterium]
MRLIAVENYDELSEVAAGIVAEMIKMKPDSVIGLPTGRTPKGMYAYLVKLHKEQGLDFSGVKTFNIDEFCGVPKSDPRSFAFYMQEYFVKHINLKPDNFHIPNGTAANYAEECKEYEKKIEQAGGFDLIVLGVGTNGHVGFNEPATSLPVHTHIVSLSEETRVAYGKLYGSTENVPQQAITMGIGTILRAERTLLLASGSSKSTVMRKFLQEERVTPLLPVSFLHLSSNLTVIADKEALGMSL